MPVEIRNNAVFVIAFVLLLVCGNETTQCVADESKAPLKVFVLAGQSNMDGHAKLSSFDHIGMDPETAPLLERMRDANGQPHECERVWISYFRGPEKNGEGFGKLTAGYGSRVHAHQSGDKIGPEFTFGIYLEEQLDGPILLIKTGWGGKSLHTDYRPPTAGPYRLNPSQRERLRKKGQDIDLAQQQRTDASGVYYRLLVEHVKRVLKDPGRICPEYDPQCGVELAGFVWFQGWNDMVDSGVYPQRNTPGGYDLYSKLMAHFIRDIRRDLSAPQLPFVIGVMGVGGPVDLYTDGQLRYRDTHDHFRKAMAAPAAMPEFRDNVTAVLTEKYWDSELDQIASKRNLVRAKTRALRKENQKMDKANALSQERQAQIVAEYRQQLFTARDLEVEKGITNAAFHYHGSAKIMAQIGKAFADAFAKPD